MEVTVDVLFLRHSSTKADEYIMTLLVCVFGLVQAC